MARGRKRRDALAEPTAPPHRTPSFIHFEGNANVEIEIDADIGSTTVTSDSGLGVANVTFVDSDITHEPGIRDGGAFIHEMRMRFPGRPAPQRQTWDPPNEDDVSGHEEFAAECFGFGPAWLCRCSALNFATLTICTDCGRRRPAHIHAPTIYQNRRCPRCGRVWTWVRMLCGECQSPLLPPLRL